MIVDFHTHFIPAAFPEKPAGIAEPSWPSLRPAPDGESATMFVGDNKFRDFESFYWDVEKRLKSMDKAGVDIQVMSPLPELVSYWLSAEAAAIITDAMNKACADMVSASGGRLRGMGVVAMQDVDYAAKQVDEIAELGPSAVFLGSHVNGKSIASEDFYAVLERAEANGLPIFIHGIKPGGLERIEGPGLMGAVMGIPYEGAMALAGFMATDIFGKFPKLDIVFAHGGGMISSVIDRMELVWSKFPGPMQASLKTPPTEYVRRFWFDTVVFNPDALRYIADRFGTERILAGSDGPTEIGQTDLPGFVAATGLPQSDRDAILGGNATRLLELTR